MKDKWTLYWVAGLTAAAVIAAAIMYLDRPRTPMMLVTAPPAQAEITELTAAQTTAHTKKTTVCRTTAVHTARTETVTTAERQPIYDLNAAEAEDLKRVSGIGDALAEAILQYRAACGGFTRRAQLLKIDGIGAVMAERIMEEFEIPDELPPEADVPEPEAEESEYYYNETECDIYDVNTVTREELLRLPDMTEAIADDILAMRERLGGYHGIYELTLIEHLSGKYFQEVLYTHLYVAGDPNSISVE